MSMKLVGKEKVDYFSKKKNEQVTGVTAYFTYTEQNPNLEGVMTSNQYAGKGTELFDAINFMTVGKEYEPQLEYNPKFGSSRVVGYILSEPINIK